MDNDKYNGVSIPSSNDTMVNSSPSTRVQNSASYQAVSLMETILFQRMNAERDNVILQRRFSIDDIIYVQECLNNLEKIELMRYEPNCINARKLISEYWGIKYRIGNCHELFKNNPYARIQENLSISQYQSTPAYSHLINLNDTAMPSKTKSVSSHINRFFALHNMSGYDNSPFRLFESRDLETSPSSIRLIYVPGFDTVKFLLSFTYYDGRDFFYRESSKIPRFKPEHSCSEFSYNLVLDTIRSLFSQEQEFSLETIDPLQTVAMLQSDAMFMHLKVSQVAQYFKMYTSDEFLDSVLDLYRLGYKEVLNLEEFITERIFKDVTFINEGLKGSFLDFMLIFDISLRYKMIAGSIGFSHSLDDFARHIDDSKNMALAFIKEYQPSSIFDFYNYPDYKMNDIKTIEDTYMESLKGNPFFQIYFVSATKSFLKGKRTIEGFPIGYNEIKDCLRWI